MSVSSNINDQTGRPPTLVSGDSRSSSKDTGIPVLATKPSVASHSRSIIQAAPPRFKQQSRSASSQKPPPSGKPPAPASSLQDYPQAEEAESDEVAESMKDLPKTPTSNSKRSLGFQSTEHERSDDGFSPDQPLSPYDWDVLLQQYHEMIAAKQQDEDQLWARYEMLSAVSPSAI